MDIATISTSLHTLEAMAPATELTAEQPLLKVENMTSTANAASQFEQALEVPSVTRIQPADHAPTALTSALTSTGDISPADLYRTQFAVSMLKTQGASGANGSRQLNQDMEALLKQQG